MRKGFTLMELMVALACAGILVSVALAVLAAYDSRTTEHIQRMQKSIRELRGCPDANRL